MNKPSAEIIARVAGISVEQVRKNAARCADDLRAMKSQHEASGKTKFRGYTLNQWDGFIDLQMELVNGIR